MSLCALAVVVVIAAVVWLIVWAIRVNRRNVKTQPGQPQVGPGAKEILQARYARGEITQAEYKKILADLEK